MQPVSFNTNPLTRNMLDGHVAQTQAMEAMAKQMQGLGQAAQVPSSLGQVSPVGPSAAPASPGQVQPADGGVALRQRNRLLQPSLPSKYM